VTISPIDPGGIVIDGGRSIEARRAESGGGVLEEGAASHQLGGLVWGSAVSSPSGVWVEPQPKLNLVHFSRKNMASGETGDYKWLTLTD